MDDIVGLWEIGKSSTAQRIEIEKQGKVIVLKNIPKLTSFLGKGQQ